MIECKVSKCMTSECPNPVKTSQTLPKLSETSFKTRLIAKYFSLHRYYVHNYMVRLCLMTQNNYGHYIMELSKTLQN